MARKGAVDNLRRLAFEFRDLLSSDPPEEDVQRFLSENRVLLDPTAQHIRPKVRLGENYITDFVIEDADQRHILVEIEQPKHPLFTAASRPSQALNMALAQVRDWRNWVAEYLTYARQALPGISRDPECRVVIGRRHQLTEEHRASLRGMNADFVGIKVLTYDDLIDRVESLASNLSQL